MNGTYEALKELQDGAATKTEFNTHANAKNNPHAVTKAQVGLSNVDNIKQAAKTDFDSHVADISIHVTAAKQTEWDAKETTVGAQKKADIALQTAKDFVAGFQQQKITTDKGSPLISIKDTSASILDAVINNGLGMGSFYAIAGSKDLPNSRSIRGFFHMTDSTNGKASFGWVYATDYLNNVFTNYLNNNVWTGWSRLSDHNLLSETGTSQLIPTGTDILTLPSGFYYAVGTNVTNMPTKNDSSWFNIYVIDNSNNRKTFHVIRSADNFNWFGTTHTDGSFRGWKQMLTDADANVTWIIPSLSNGWKQYVSPDGFPHTLRYSKDAFGVVEIIGSIYGGTLGNDVPAFTLPAGYRPLQSTHRIGVASSIGTPGVPQFHRTYIGTDGRVCIQSSSNTSNPTEFITFGFRFRSA
ncbi:hypothetical protein [Bacillus sp. Bos-x628]|uniref:hypothetical protein n=1 Tax=Bacillus maqinnsis TaxID=3229854 RepID=UPI00338FBF1B